MLFFNIHLSLFIFNYLWQKSLCIHFNETKPKVQAKLYLYPKVKWVKCTSFSIENTLYINMGKA